MTIVSQRWAHAFGVVPGAVWAAAITVVTQWPGLLLTPGVSHDEAALNRVALAWARTGHQAVPLLAEIGTYGHAYYWNPPGHAWVMGTAYSWFGFGEAVTRGVTLVEGGIGAGLLYAVARRLWNSAWAGAMAALLLVCHPLFYWLCRSGRMDLEELGCLLGAVWVLRPWAGPASGGRAAAAGLLVGAGSLFHVLALLWAPALVAADVAARRRLAWRPGLSLLGAAALPVTFWLAAAWFGPDRKALVEQFWTYAVLNRTAGGPLWLRPWAELRRAASDFAQVPLLGLGILAFSAVLVGTGTGSAARRWILGGLATVTVLVAFLTAKDTGAYPLHWYLWLCLAAGGALAWFQETPVRRQILGALCLLVVGNAGGRAAILWAAAEDQKAVRSPARLAAFFREQVPAGSVVVGPESIWYATEAAGAQLRIWVEADPARHDFFVSPVGEVSAPPLGFERVATLPGDAPRFLGHYFSSTPFGYDLWRSGLSSTRSSQR